MPNIDIKPKVHPLLADLPAKLKDPRNYDKIRKQIFDTIATKHNHIDILEYSKCKDCTEKMLKRRVLLRRLGFKNPAQYMAWQKVHTEIKARFPLVDWKKQ